MIFKILIIYFFRSIRRTAKVDPERLAKYVNEEIKDFTIPLEHDKEVILAKQILRFSDVILLTLESLHLHKICDYLYQLSVVFNDFYKNCYVVEVNKETKEQTINYHRLVLCEVAADTVKKCFEILGIRPLEIM